MRPIWKGALSFGLVNIPVELMSAEDSNELSFNLMDLKDNARIKYQRINAETGKEVPWEDIVKSYEFSDGSFVIVTDEDFEKADPKAAKTVDIEEFIVRDELSPIYLEKPYFVVPIKGGEKPYVLLRDALIDSDKIGIGRVTIRTKQSLCAIIPENNGLILNLLRYPEELRDMEKLNLPESVKSTKKELDLAIKLVDDLTVKWDPDAHEDTYNAALLKRIEAKAKHEIKDEDEDTSEKSEAKDNVIDLMELLKRSIEEKTGSPKKAAPNKKESEKKTPSKKGQNKKTSSERKSS